MMSESPVDVERKTRMTLHAGANVSDDEFERLSALQPLAGVLIADLTSTLPGPYCTSLLQRLGARVIKFEPPWGDISHSFPTLYEAVNGGKESVVVDLRLESDVKLVRAVVRRSDAFVEGWRPGVAKRLSLGPEDLFSLNPALVYCSISGYGVSDERKDRPGHDLNYVAASGLADLFFADGEPRPLGVPIADLAGGVFAALRVATGILAARISGRGGFIDVSLTAALRDWVEAVGAGKGEYTANQVLNLPHYGVFRTSEGQYLTLGTAYEDNFWRDLCRVLSLDEFVGLSTEERLDRTVEIRATIAERIAAMGRDELESELRAADTCWAFVDRPAQVEPPGGMLASAIEEAPALGAHSDTIRAEFT